MWKRRWEERGKKICCKERAAGRETKSRRARAVTVSRWARGRREEDERRAEERDEKEREEEEEKAEEGREEAATRTST